MNKARFIRLFKSLSSKENRAFVRYVKSPFFNRNERLVSLLEWLNEQNLDGEINKNDAFRSMFGKNTAFNEQQVYDHLSALQKLLEGFLAYQSYQDQPMIEKRLLMQNLLGRNYPDLFQRHHNQARKWMASQEQDSPETYLQTFFLSKYADEYFGQQRKRGLDAGDSLREEVENLDIFYMVCKLRSSCEMLNRNNIINTTYEPLMVEEMCEWLESASNPYKEVPLIAIYYRIYKTLTDSQTEAHYEELVKLLDEKSHRFPLALARDLYGYATNYCTKQINSGNQAYLSKIFLLFQDLLKKEILIEDGYLVHWHFKNIATVGLRLKEYEWVLDFLETYKEKIHPEQRENAYNFNLSTLYYQQDQLTLAMRQLQKVSFTDVYYDLSARSLLLKIYYESKEYDSLFYHIKAFQTYLRRNKQVSGYQRKIYHNLLKLVKKLVKIDLQREPVKADEMRRNLLLEIQEIREIADLKWLRTKVG
ncbi:MAG: hypothetical protein AAF587_21540 [Bacteroidota bacterium]